MLTVKILALPNKKGCYFISTKFILNNFSDVGCEEPSGSNDSETGETKDPTLSLKLNVEEKLDGKRTKVR